MIRVDGGDRGDLGNRGDRGDLGNRGDRGCQDGPAPAPYGGR